MIALLSLMLRSFLRGGGGFALIAVPVVTWLVVRIVAGVEGSVMLNGEAVAIEANRMAGWALRWGLGIANILIALVMLFLALPLAIGGLEQGSGRFDLTAPVSRFRWLANQTLGLGLLLVSFWLLASIGAAVALGRFPVSLPSAAAHLALGHLLFIAIAIGTSVAWGYRVGALLTIVVWGGSWIFAHDVVEAYLFDVPAPEEGFAGLWYTLLAPYLEGEPVGFVPSVLRFMAQAFPPIANEQSVGFDIAAGRDVFPTMDARSTLVAAIWCVVSWLLAARTLRKQDI